LRGAIGRFELSHVFRREFRCVQRDSELVDRAGKREWDLIVVVIDRRASLRADVEGLVDRGGAA
jgi:hypothetical protein